MTELTPIPGSESVITDDEAEVLRQLAEARQHRGEWEKVEADLRKKAIQIVKGGGDGVVAITGSGTPVARITVSSRRTVDSKKLEALHPDVYAEVVKETPVEKLEIL
jgi:antitoxin (DNA-binding transcriptional repressor) of toxin-antitoxin stability system